MHRPAFSFFPSKTPAMSNSISCALFVLIVLAAASCTAPRYGFSESGTDHAITESLFDFKERTISEADIQRILDGKINIPDTIRLAVFQFGGAPIIYRRWYDEENLKTRQQLIDTFTQAIQGASRVQKVVLLPSMVTGNQPNIHQLRESAVRLQADMLLVYSLHSDIFQKYRAFKKDEIKAFATCEMILMDIRTGVIPFTNIATKSAQSKKDKEDFDAEELKNRAQQMAVLQAMLETGNRVAGFLNDPK